MPSVCLIAGALFIKACANWCQLQENQTEENTTKSNTVKDKVKVTNITSGWKENEEKFSLEIKKPAYNQDSVNFVSILFIFCLAHVIGVLIMNSPQLITTIGGQYNYSSDISLFYTFVLFSAALLLLPVFVTFKSCEKSVSILNILSLLELGTALICISMNNFSLALFCSVIYVPLALIIGITHCR